MRTGYICSWGDDVRCGLRTYQDYLIDGFRQLDESVTVDVTRLARRHDIDADYLEWVAKKAVRNGINVLNVQHEGGRYGFEEAALYDAIPDDIPVVTTIHSAAQLDGSQKRHILRGSDKVIVHNAGELDSLLPCDTTKPVIVPHGCKMRDPPSKARSAAVLQQDRIPDFVALTFGFAGPWKSIETVQNAVHATAGITHVHAGEWNTDAPHGSYARKIVQRGRNMLPFRSSFTGYVDDDDMSAVFGLADVAVYANKWASESGSMAEMMGAGVPVIARNIEPFNDGRPALLFDDERELQDKLRVLRDDGSLRDSLSSRGKEWARERSWENVAGIHYDLYRHVTRSSAWEESIDPMKRYDRVRRLADTDGDDSQIERMADRFTNTHTGDTAAIVNGPGQIPDGGPLDTIVVYDFERYRHPAQFLELVADAAADGGNVIIRCETPSNGTDIEHVRPLWPHELVPLAESVSLETDVCTLIIGADSDGDVTDRTVGVFEVSRQ